MRPLITAILLIVVLFAGSVLAGDDALGLYFSSTEFTEELDGLGASLRVSSSDDEISFTVSALNKQLPAVVALLEEVILEPRFDADAFARLKKDRLTSLSTRSDQIRSITRDAWSKLIHAPDDIRSKPSASRQSPQVDRTSNRKGLRDASTS